MLIEFWNLIRMLLGLIKRKGQRKMEFNEWSNRYKNRNDISSRLTHLTKESTERDAFQTLLKILDDKVINGSTTETGFIIGNKPAVCLQEAPLNAIAENWRYEKKLSEEGNGKARYSGFGIRFCKSWIYKIGGRPVIYEKRDLMKELLPKEEHWRIVNYDLEDNQHIIDWSHEREWRVQGDIKFEYKCIEVLVQSNRYYQEFIKYCIKNEKLEILQEINGIVVLDTIFY